MGKIGISSVLFGTRHIHMLNGYSFPRVKKTVFKYLPLDRFVGMVDKNELVFVSPETWYDPFEQLYFGIDCSARGYNTEDIVCMCVSEKSSTNEDACWRVYAGDNREKTVRISIEQEKLIGLLDDYAEANGFEVYIGKANYAFEKNEIRKLYEPSSTYYSDFFPPVMTREHYLSLMLLKRKAFNYENEVRIFLVRDSIPSRILPIPCDYKATGLVSSIMLAPYPPVRELGDLAFKVREKLNNLESAEIKAALKAKIDCVIQQSLLYKVYPRIEKAK